MKKDLGIVIAVVLIIVILLSSFLYNRPANVFSRTIAYDLPEEAEIVETRRYGVLYYTRAYQMKIKISHEEPEQYLNLVLDTYDDVGRFMSYEEYQEFANNVFVSRDIVPVVEPNTTVYVSILEFTDGVKLMHIVASANQSDAYMYVYWSKE